MIGIGVLALLISTVQNHSSMQALRAEFRRGRTAVDGDARRRSLRGAWVGIALVAVILRWLSLGLPPTMRHRHSGSVAWTSVKGCGAHTKCSCGRAHKQRILERT